MAVRSHPAQNHEIEPQLLPRLYRNKHARLPLNGSRPVIHDVKSGHFDSGLLPEDQAGESVAIASRLGVPSAIPEWDTHVIVQPSRPRNPWAGVCPVGYVRGGEGLIGRRRAVSGDHRNRLGNSRGVIRQRGQGSVAK
jgi:hypothetical protein